MGGFNWRSGPRSFLSFGDQFIGALLYLLGGQCGTLPIDTLSVCLDAKNSQRFGRTTKRIEHYWLSLLIQLFEALQHRMAGVVSA